MNHSWAVRSRRSSARISSAHTGPSSWERAFRFRHLLIRDAAYESITKATRAELHERFAGWLGSSARTPRSWTSSSATTSSGRRATSTS